jgi:hypothetical protein
MSYRKPLLRIDLADKLDEEAYEDLWVVIRNPRIMPTKMLTPAEVKTDENGRPVDPAAADRAMYEVLARLVHDWNLTDPMAEDQDNAQVLPRTVDAFVESVPLAVINYLSNEVIRSTDPR